MPLFVLILEQRLRKKNKRQQFVPKEKGWGTREREGGNEMNGREEKGTKGKRWRERDGAEGTVGKGDGEMGIFKKIYYICLFETKTTFRPTLCVKPPPY
jgi:hypothetical protein